MRVRTFTEMMLEYGRSELDHDDQLVRKEMLANHPFSLIVEGGHMELENLENWIMAKIGSGKNVFLYYGKTDYDFRFAEYFFDTEDEAMRTAEVVTNIYTLYPHSLTPTKAFRSIGNKKEVECDPNDSKAIIFDPPKEV